MLRSSVSRHNLSAVKSHHLFEDVSTVIYLLTSVLWWKYKLSVFRNLSVETTLLPCYVHEASQEDSCDLSAVKIWLRETGLSGDRRVLVEEVKTDWSSNFTKIRRELTETASVIARVSTQQSARHKSPAGFGLIVSFSKFAEECNIYSKHFQGNHARHPVSVSWHNLLDIDCLQTEGSSHWWPCDELSPSLCMKERQRGGDFLHYWDV